MRTDKTGNKCGQCIDKGDVVDFCTTCQLSMCTKCSSSHKSLQRYQDHKVKRSTEVSKQLVMTGHKKYCKEHDEELKYFCQQCQESICTDCRISDTHRDHTHRLIKDTLKEKKEEVDTLIKKGRVGSDSIKDFLEVSQQVGWISNKINDLLRSMNTSLLIQF